MYQFKFADIGEGLHEGKVIKIYAKLGDQVTSGQPLFEVETDKVTSEITSPVAGKVVEIKISLEQTIHVGEVVMVIDDQPAPAPAASGGASVVGQVTVSDEVIDMGFFKSAKKASSTNKANTSPTPSKLVAVPKGMRISPLLRKFASNHQIDLNLVKPTGPNNTVTQADLDLVLNQNQAAPAVVSAPVAPASPTPVAAAPAAAPAVATTPQKASFGFVAQRVKTTGLRQAIAKNLKGSWDHVAYTNLVLQADVTKLWNLRSAIKDPLLKTSGIKITFLPFIAKATTIALSEFPIFTTQYDEKTQELVYPSTINLGIAVDTDYGLVVPNIKDAQTKSVLALAAEIGDLATKARKKTLKGAEMANGTFTITNYGSAGSLFGTPVIKHPELAILGVGAIIDQYNAQGELQKIMYLTTAADHRWVDGAEVGRFTSRIKQLLENPDLLSVY